MEKTTLLASRPSVVRDGAIDTFERHEYVRGMRTSHGDSYGSGFGLQVREVSWVVTLGAIEGKRPFRQRVFSTKKAGASYYAEPPRGRFAP